MASVGQCGSLLACSGSHECHLDRASVSSSSGDQQTPKRASMKNEILSILSDGEIWIVYYHPLSLTDRPGNGIAKCWGWKRHYLLLSFDFISSVLSPPGKCTHTTEVN